MAKENDVEFLEFVVKVIVDHPEDVKVDRTVDEMGVLLTLNINPEDMGYVIGRKGQNASAIRTLLRVVGARNNSRVNMKINEPEGSRPRPSRDEKTEAPVAAPAVDESADVSVDDLNI